MSSCGGNCGCGSDCKCGKGCGCGSKMYPDVERSSSATLIEGVAPFNMYSEGSEMEFGGEGGHTCKCGDTCKCNSCKC